MIFDELNGAVDLYLKWKAKNKEDRRKQASDITLITLYTLGENGKHGVFESQFNDIKKLSSVELFTAIKEGIFDELIVDASSHDGNQWLLSIEGRRYVEALLRDMKK